MSTGGIGGFKTTVSGATDFTATAGIGEIISISLPELGVTDIDVSTMDSASNYMEYIPGSVEPGVMEIEVNYDDDADALFLAALATVQVYTITFPDNSTYATSGYMNKAGGGTAGTNEKITRNVSIKCSGLPTAVTGTAS